MAFSSRLKKEVWRVIRTLLVAGIIISVVITLISYGKKINRPEAISMIIDSDSGNEMDDLFAISLALIDPKVEIIGLTSAQWNIHPLAGDSSVYVSQKINEDLLMLHDTIGIPHPLGADDQTGYWGDRKPIPSPAADFILEKVKEVPYGDKLNIVTLGAVTNLATAIMMDSSIVDKIVWYGMGLFYNEKTRVWDKNEFNTRNDLEAMDYLLNRIGLETHIMTATTSRSYKFGKVETFDLIEGRGPEWDYLVDRWRKVAPESREWIMWDVALLQAIMNPDLVTEKEVDTPDENISRRIFAYTWLDEKKMKREYWKMVRVHMGDLSD
ncbi:nucleoside hydrolase [Bacteroidota bacterium]